MFALDTNIAIDMLRRHPAILARVIVSNPYYLPAPVLGELVHGAFKSQQSAAQMTMIATLIQRFPVVAVDEHAARRYGQVKYILEAQGQRIPENDIWIAAVCLRWGITLVTRDQHFTHVAGLRLEIW